MMGTTVSNVNDANTGTPTISGTLTEDETLTADASPLTGNDEDGMTSASYTYQWQRCTSNAASSCSSISGATSTYICASTGGHWTSGFALESVTLTITAMRRPLTVL